MKIITESLFVYLTLPTAFSLIIPNNESIARIVNGDEVPITAVPYQAAIRKQVLGGWAFTCGGVIVHKKAVLTAAHCIVGTESSPSSLQITVGTISRVSGGQTYKVFSVHRHHEYSPVTLLNDIALLVTTEEMNLRSEVAVIPLTGYNTEIPEGTEALVSGFGAVSYDGAASPVLLAARVKIISQAECSQIYLGMATIYHSMICAIGTEPLRDACHGDSGGPLVVDGTLIGLVSFGEGCAHPNFAGVYTRVSSHYYWIYHQIENV